MDESLVQELDSTIDGINIRNRSQAVEFFVSKSLRKNKTAVILATKIDDFRVLSEVKGELVIIHTIKLLQSYNFKNLFIIGEKRVLSKIFEILGTGQEQLVNIEYVEDVNPKGSAYSLSLLKDRIDSTFLVIPGDNYFNMDLNSFWEFHAKSNNTITLAITSSDNPTRLGVVDLQGSEVTGFEQKPEKSDNYLVWTGIMICEPELLYKDAYSVEDDLIPELIEMDSLSGFTFTGEWKNIHTKSDVKELNK